MRGQSWCLVILLGFYLCGVVSQSIYTIGDQGLSCTEVCYALSLNCNPAIETNNTADIFQQLGITCDLDSADWWAEDQPAYISGDDPRQGQCLGYMNVPSGVLCSGNFHASRRLCRCDKPSYDLTTFGTALAGFTIDANETWVFAHVVAPGDFGVMQHFWTTAPNPEEAGVIINYYVDGETSPSISFQPSLACGVGFNNNFAPWGTKWFGKGAADGGFFWNFRVPFQNSIVVTASHTGSTSAGGFYMIVRGTTNIPFYIGDLPIPSSARLVQYTNNRIFEPLEFVTIASAPSGHGVFFMHTISALSGTINFLEGCYHLLVGNQVFPGTLLSSGTEDFFDSGWYFNAGEFHLPVSGFTYLNTSDGKVAWSAYRFHEMDPITFNNGFTMLWRNGDMLDKAGIKCLIESGGSPAGNPTNSTIFSYAWYYVW